jgi:hypothetical protein
MADYSVQIEHLINAAKICEQHEIESTNGIKTYYPRWPVAWEACEIVWRNYLDMKTMDGKNDERDRQIIINEANQMR